jgi:predicted ferric reductase
MNKVTTLLVAAWLVGSLLYACSPGPSHLLHNPTTWELREQLVFLTGVWAMSFMVLSVIVSARFGIVTHLTGGLDKAYVVHKRAGIYTTVFAILHWSLENVPHWLVAWGVIPNPGELTDGSQFSDLEIVLFQSGVLLAELSFYLLLVLVVIALMNKIPYHIFRITHKIFPGLFLLFTWHAATAQLKEHWLSSPAGYMLLGLLLLGNIAAITGLLQRIGKSRQGKAIIQDITLTPSGILHVHLETPGHPFIHRPGQYAFLQFSHSREPHPFSIVSSGDPGTTLRFAIKDLGDFTHNLPHAIHIGQPVTVEGPYGEFTFEDDCEHQLWIAGGIGITPFLSQLEHLSARGGATKRIDFWYCTRGKLAQQFPANLADMCRRSNVNFIHIDSLQERLSPEALLATCRDSKRMSVWFCGPDEMRKRLQMMLQRSGLPKGRFHYDSFRMR